MINTIWSDKTTGQIHTELKRWVASRIWPDSNKRFGKCVCLGVFDDLSPIAVAVYHDYNPDAAIIELSAAAIDRRWLTRRVLKTMFEYPFKQAGIQMVVMRVSANDKQKHLHRMLKAYGFKGQTIKRLYGRCEDGIVFSLTDDDWRSNRFNKGQHYG